MKKLSMLFLASSFLLFGFQAQAQTPLGYCLNDSASMLMPTEGGSYLTGMESATPCAPTSTTFINLYKPKENYIPFATGINPLAVHKTIKIRIRVINPYVDPSGSQVNYKSADITYLQSVVDRANYFLANNQAPTDGITIGGRNPWVSDTRLRLEATAIDFLSNDLNYSNTLTHFNSSFCINPNDELNVFVLWDEDVFPSTSAPAGGIALNTPRFPTDFSTYDELLTGENSGISYIFLKGLYQNAGTKYNVDWTANLLIHEIGHQLGLHHTYGTDWGTYTGHEIDDSGYDYLADVFGTGSSKKYPRPSNSADCQTLAKASIAPNDYWINNFMSGNPEGQNISPMQLGRIHRNAHFLRDRQYLYNTYPEDDNHDHTGQGQLNPLLINNNQTWDFDIKMYNDIVVKTGATLTITCRVLMPFHSNIVVEPGAKLIIDGGHITSDRKHTMWYGISVLGQKHLSQDVAGAQGILEMKNNATISNALHAITLGNAVGGAYTATSAGGIAYINNAHFINNRSSLQFSDYENWAIWPVGAIRPNRTYIANTSFLLDDDYHMDNTLIKGPNGQIEASGVRGVKISGCHFENKMNATTRAIFGSGYAISSWNAGFIVSDYCTAPLLGMPCPSVSVVPSIIRGFEVGVLALSVTENDKKVAVVNTLLENNSIGFYGGTVNTIDLHHNQFVVKDLTGKVHQNMGARIETSTNFNVQENSFINKDTLEYYFPTAPDGDVWYKISDSTLGVLVDRCGSDNNIIRRNKFDFLGYGNYARKNNTNGYSSSWLGDESRATGLQYTCNTYGYNASDQFVLGTDSVNHGIRVYQAKYDNPAGNTFANDVDTIFKIGDYKNFIVDNYTASSLFLAQSVRAYYYKFPATINQDPVRYTVGKITKIKTTYEPDCNSYYSGSWGSLEKVGGIGSSLSHAAFMAALDDTTEQRSSNLHAAYVAMNSPYALLDNSLLYLKEGNSSAAYNSYNAIAQSFDLLPEEAAEFELGRLFVNMVARHYQDSIVMDSLSVADIDTLHYLLNNATMWVKTKACHWLAHAIGETCVPEQIEMPITTANNNMRHGHNNAIDAGKPDQILINPNPSQDYYELHYNLQQEQDAQLIISDLSGRTISIVSLDYHKNSIRIDARNWANGMYLYSVKQGTKTIHNGKLIKY